MATTVCTTFALATQVALPAEIRMRQIYELLMTLNAI